MPDLLVAGVTGLIGGEILTKDLSQFNRVICLARKDIDLAKEYYQLLKTDFVDIVLPDSQSDDAVICALGTTIKKAGSQKAFKQVDYQMVMNLAKAAKEKGYERFLLVSSLGADHQSRNFYLKTKGELEESLKSLGFKHLCFVRPSLLLGDRKEFRLGEKIGMVLLPLINPLLMGKLKRYGPIDARRVAERLVKQSREQSEALVVFESDEI